MKALSMIVIVGILLGGSMALSEEDKKAATKQQEDGKEATDLPVPKLIDEDSEAPAKPAGGESFSAAVNVIRKIDRVEVVFRNGESYYLPSGSRYSEIYNACLESERTGKAISVTVNPKTRIIQSVGAGGGTNKTK
ncbi:MAG: hypothetical protein KF789_09215 [Bdellovibrionaceae bacterium]|nr:hypothetical protein [Pseudobdellovibrionaceae bacterium]